MKKILHLGLFIIITLICIFASGCEVVSESLFPSAGTGTSAEEAQTSEAIDISINGSVEETLEIYSDYIEKGVSCPADYTVITHGTVQSDHIGTYKLTYLVYSNIGEEIKVLHRYVHVVDTTGPEYTDCENPPILYAGFTYTIEDFVSEYHDNSNTTISVEPQSITFTSPGSHTVEFTLTDVSGNETQYQKVVAVELDMKKLLYEVYKDASYKISTHDTSMGYDCTRVSIDDNTSFGYFGSGSIHFTQEIESTLGKYTTISISADYGEFNNASVSFHVSNLSGRNYSTGSATINVFQDTVTVKEFDWTINDLSLDEQKMLSELNSNINSVITNFHEYMNNTLHIEIK